MIKTHLFAAYASCTLLWCSLAIELAAQGLSQSVQQLTFRKVDIPIEGEYIDAVFYTDSLSQELRPKIIIRKESVDFMTREGLLRHRVIAQVGESAKIAAHGRYIGFYHEGRFSVYKDSGESLWQDTPPNEGDEDVPERRYRISSQGIVCTVLRDKGKVIFHNQQGTIIAEHGVTNSMSRTLDGDWSPDGEYFLVSATMTGMYRDNRLFLFDARGTKLWEIRTDNRWAVDVEFSSKSSWASLTYRDLSARTFGIAIISTRDGSIARELSHSNLLYPFISSDERYLLAKDRYLKERSGQRLVLFDIQAGAQLFEIFLSKPIVDYVVFPDDQAIFALHQSEIVKLDMTGAVVGSYDLGELDTSQNTLQLQGESTADRVLIRSQKSFLYLNPSN
ncbi:MAG: hypothetical protein DKINENOH_04080 [bacterium]|nr:hypothetical protein [bacterium]